MDEHFYNNDFERFLQQQVKQHRMYPSDAVWKGIYKQVHGHRRWPGLYFIAILMVAALTVCTVLIDSNPGVNTPVAVLKKTTPVVDQLDPAQVTHETLTNIRRKQEEQPGLDIPDVMAAVHQDKTVAAGRTYSLALIRDQLHNANTELIAGVADITPGYAETGTTDEAVASTAARKTRSGTAAAAKKNTSALLQSLITDKLQAPGNDIQNNASQSVVKVVKPSRWAYQFYITPAVNYREIVDQKPTGEKVNAPMISNYGVNAAQVIRYRPGMGIELGLGVLYNINERVKLKAALQYNVRQYNIEAYAGNYEMAKIALVRRGYIDSIDMVSQYRSNNGYSETLLLNKYHQVSMPVGIEYALVNAKKFGVNLAGTLQPTYTFSQSAYLLSSDYKSYVNGASMIRQWNINTSLEATFSYKVGDFQWKLGPQIRYQHLPSYTDAYPIKEYLVDYGFKIGFTKTIK